MLGDVPLPTLTDVNRAVHDIVECIEVSFVTRDYRLAYLICLLSSHTMTIMLAWSHFVAMPNFLYSARFSKLQRKIGLVYVTSFKCFIVCTIASIKCTTLKHAKLAKSDFFGGPGCPPSSTSRALQSVQPCMCL